MRRAKGMGKRMSGRRARGGSLGASAVRRRRVFYVPGFDPLGPRRYRELYRSQAATQARISGHSIVVRGAGPAGWEVSARIEGRSVTARVEVLGWHDLVRGALAGGIGASYARLARTAWIYLRSGALPRLARLRRGPVIAGAYPAVMLLAQALVAGLLALGLWAVLTPVLEPALGAMLAPAPAAAMARVLAGLAALLAIPVALQAFARADGRLLAHYLMADFAFAAAHRGAYGPALEARLAAFRGRVAAALAEEGCDEVLVVGHSSGAHLAVSLVADLLRAGQVRQEGPALALLTLGQAIPMISFLPRAGRLRADLRLLAAEPRIAWVDVTAPGDGASFALCDPVAVSGVAPAQARWPLVLSAAFRRTLSPRAWAALRWRFHRRHFQYLMAFDRPGSYDYFAI